MCTWVNAHRMRVQHAQGTFVDQDLAFLTEDRHVSRLSRYVEALKARIEGEDIGIFPKLDTSQALSCL